MSRPSKPQRGAGRPRVVGQPGGNAAQREGHRLAQAREVARLYRGLSLRILGVAVALGLGVVAAAAHAVGGDPLRAVAVAAAVLIGVDVLIRFPAAVATTVVIVAGSVAAAPISAFYAAAANQGMVDRAGAVATMWATLTLAGLLAHRTSRGRPWLTTLLVALAIIFVAPWLLMLAPWAGFVWAWAVMAAVLFLRGGGIAWIREQASAVRSFNRRRQARTEVLGRERADRDTKRAGEVLTGELLEGLPAEYTVFHDRRLPTGLHLDHVIVGPTGVFLVASHKFKGRIFEHPTSGLTHPQVSIADLLNDTDTTAALLRGRLKVRGLRVSPLVVIHDAVLPEPRLRVALSADETRLGVVTVLAPSMLVTELTEGAADLNDRQVERLTHRIDRFCPPAANKAVPVTGVAAVPVQVTLLDEHNNTKTVGDHTTNPLFVSSTSGLAVTVGQPVTILTDQGTFDGFRVTGAPQPADGGVLYVPLARTTDRAVVPSTDTDFWFPLDSVQPVAADS